MNRNILKYSIGLTSFLLAGIAAYFSITGLAKLFAGTGAAILVMATALELSKVLSVSYLYRFWNDTSKALKIYLSIAVIILMMITSLGIYGFLTAGYQTTKAKFDIANTSIISLNNKKSSIDTKIQSFSTSISSYNQRLNELITQRNNVERRIEKSFDSNRFNISNKQSNSAKYIDSDIKNVTDKLAELENTKLVLMDSSAAISLKITQTDLNNQTSTELGPIVYISKLTNISLDSLVNGLILLFIFVFDPLAIALLMVFNSLSLDTNTIAVSEDITDQTINTTIVDNSSSEIVNDPIISTQEVINKEPFTELETLISKKENVQERPPNNAVKTNMYSDVR